MKYPIIAFTLSVASSLSWAQTYLSPNQIGSGNLPGTHADLVFQVGDGNWTSPLLLPATAADKARIRIESYAGYNTQVLQANSDVPLPSMRLARGQWLQYFYSNARKRWEIDAPVLKAQNNGKPMIMANTTNRVLRVFLGDGAWAPSVSLPAVAPDGALLMLRSDAGWTSRIDPANVQYASTMPLRRQDTYAFVFNQKLGKWTLHSGAETALNGAALPQGVIPVPSTPLTRVTLTDLTGC